MSHACNCIICAREFNSDELDDKALLQINSTKFKICNACFNKSDPIDDYKEVKSIIDSYLNSLIIKRDKKNQK